MLFDTHAHLDDKRFDNDRDEFILSLKNKNISNVLIPGTKIETSKNAAKLAEKYDFIYAGVGFQPSEIPKDADINKNIQEIKKLAQNNKKVIAIGEIGLDYYYDKDTKLLQLIYFEEQLKIAKELDLPVLIHNRDAHSDTLELLKKYQPRGVIHCCTASAEFVKEFLKLGMYISFTGVITFKNASRILESAKTVPLNRLLIETDSPYMAPEPFRGKRCDPTMVAKVCEKLAKLSNISFEQMADITYNNAKRLFKI